jgi:endonuclease YncB( thermonuclease family)
VARVRRTLATLGLATQWLLIAGSAARADDARPPATSYPARAVYVRDGDSLIVSDGTRQGELRLAEIDAPERGQPWGRRAAQALRTLVEREPLHVEFVELDRYGREVSRVWADGVCVACELLRGGHAWAFRKYSRDPELIALERRAREARVGLWGQPAHSFVPPWEWREGVRRVSLEAAALAALSERAAESERAPACGNKRTRREMSSCAEARFHLEQCGLTRLDRDRDGVACEELCF